ncbi:cold-shock protein [Dongia deserti]
MKTGKIKWFNVQKGFGFIQPDGAAKDVFLHISTVERAGIGFLSEGQAVSFEIVRERGKEAAANLKLIRPQQRCATVQVQTPTRNVPS